MRAGNRTLVAVAAVAAAGAIGCSFTPERRGGPGSSGGGPRPTIVYPGTGTPGGGSGGSGGGTFPDGAVTDGNYGCGSNLTGTLRDFKQAHPDFEEIAVVDDRGIVAAQLGNDTKPVYAGNPQTPTTSGQAAFDQWYRDVPDVNQSVLVTLPFVNTGAGIFSYDNSQFFPIDGRLWGNEGHPHNFHFTFELHTRFLYQGGETFRFRGDDDVFTFINGQQVVDLGGVHLPEEQVVQLDAEAARLGLTPGNSYALDFFFAERHQTMSNFRIDTTLFFVDCGHIVE